MDVDLLVIFVDWMKADLNADNKQTKWLEKSDMRRSLLFHQKIKLTFSLQIIKPNYNYLYLFFYN